MPTPCAEDWPGRPTESGTRAEQFTLWALRLWWRCFPELDYGWMHLVQGFRQCNAAPALEPCHRFCSIVLATAGCGQHTACLYTPWITSTEEQLLLTLAIANDGDARATEAALATFVPPAAARLACPHAIRYAQALQAAGIAWPTRRGSAPPPRPTAFHLLH